MTRGSLVLICVVGACSCSPAPSSTMAAVLDSLVPGTRIGALATPVAQKLKLKADPFFGYSDTNYRPASGFRGIMLQVDEHLSFDHGPSDSARIVRVSLDLDSRQAASSMLDLLTRKLGPPRRYCFKPAYAPAPFQGDLYYWPADTLAGLLLMPLDASRGTAGGGAGRGVVAILTFGAMRPEMHPDFKSARRGGCDAA
jgi:hypothetical protein